MAESVQWTGKRILIVSHEAWGPVRLSKHHYAAALMAAGAHVFFLGPDEHIASGVSVERAADNAPAIVHRPPPMRGMRLLPRAMRAKAEAMQIDELADACGGAFDILWNFDLHRFRSLTARSHARLRIQHVMDLRKAGDLGEPACHADLVIVVSPGMAKGLDERTTRILHLPHAWMPRPHRDMDLPSFPPGPRLGYLGNLAMRGIHWPSLLEIARRHPKAQLFLMGPLSGAFGESTRLDPEMEAALRALPNVHFTGALPYDHVPAWLEAMDVLLIAYDPKALGNPATSSHKLLEYLASGRVVLSSHLEDHADLDGLMVMARPGRSITEAIDKVILDLDDLNAPKLKQERKAYAASRTYTGYLQQIATALAMIERAAR
jgi:glycosyltransferase involved in cell wall biosynthesis